MKMDSQNYRLQMWYTGHVQGVGFRWKAAEIAKGYEVCGYVENLEDGRVHISVKGEKAEVRVFADRLGEVMADFIRSIEEREDICESKYRGFTIKA